MGRIIFGSLTISKHCRLLLYIVISVEVNPLQYSIVAQQMESEDIVSISNFFRFMQILGYFGNTCMPQYSKCA